MHFSVSGVAAAWWVPLLAGFGAAALTTPAGLSGAFVLLPFQTNVLGFTTPAVSATNLVFNVVATPGGLVRYARQRLLRFRLVAPLLAGTVPGVAIGAVLRVLVLHRPAVFQAVVGVVLVYLVAQILVRSRQSRAENPETPGPATGPWRPPRSGPLVALGLGSGITGGILGVGGGAISATGICTYQITR